MAVTGQDSKSDGEKINILMYIMGEESEDVTLQFTQQPSTNIIFERFKFNSRVQNSGETIESFITSLHSLAEHCDYGMLKDQLIRDRIVVGMSDVKTSEKLQLRDKLTLTECITIAKQAELQAIQSKELLGRQTQINKISATRRFTGANKGFRKHSERNQYEGYTRTR
ncbi:hypothetical protein NQ318_021737 [Aromia moschata]|uniref:Uncharacterized protein n=1 Tax=Aromia moschata TaxID=1265417 RepID=A0AAV8Y0G8_9CUCU|nr:hypothetical protein NQ318_021737 [Aromia moschata]